MKRLLPLITLLLLTNENNADNLNIQKDSKPIETQASNNLRDNIEFILFSPDTSKSNRLLPINSKLSAVKLINDEIIIELELPEKYIENEFNETDLEDLSRLIDFNLDEISPQTKKIHLLTTYKGKRIPLSNLLNITPVPDKEPLQERKILKLNKNKSNHTGALSDKTLFISQAHGWIDYDSSIEWETQRGITHDIVEDFVNAEAINQYLLEFLNNAGAKVFTLRERDMNSQMVIVDNEDGTNFPANGTYEEIGDMGLFTDSGANGFKNFQAPYSSTNDPFRSNGGTDRLITTNPTETARVVWQPVIPEDGYYHVYVSYSGVGDRASDAKYIVSHGGIETEVTVNQEIHRYVWNHIGQFYFKVGSDDFIALSNESSEAGTTVSADAIRIGGGMGDIQGNYHPVVSTHPRWEEGARPWVQYQGASSTIYASGDVSARSRFADWEHFSIEDSIYVSWHSNAFNGSARGTSSYIYSSNPPDGTYDDTQAITGSAELQQAIHDEIINDISVAWDANWTDRGYRSAYFGEINPVHNDEMPALLIEMAFHDNADDADDLRHPQFRKLVARSVYQGIVKYFATRDGITAQLLPETPTNLSVISQSTDSINISWQAPLTDNDGVLGDAATSYMVYLSSDGKNFDNGVETSLLNHQVDSLESGKLFYVKVRAKNSGGLSLSSETLTVKTQSNNDNNILIVNGFDRLNSGQLIYQNMPDVGGFVDRMYLQQMNSFDYAIAYANSLNNLYYGFDSVSNEAIESGLINLNPSKYAAVFWVLGEESSLGSTLTSTEQSHLINYLNAGGNLFISGAEIAWDLDHLGSVSDQSFYHNVIMAEYLSDDADTFEANGLANTPFENIDNITFDDGTHGIYRVEYPDVIGALNSASSCMHYIGAQSACIYLNTGIYKVIHLGFPFETIYPATKQDEIMLETMNYFNIANKNDLIFTDGFE